jgi:tripeptide aminopeptidase
LATQPKSLLSLSRRVSPEEQRIAELAESPALSRARRWLSTERAWITEQHLAICRIPAPTFFEERRARWLAEQLRAFRWEATLDRAGNVIAMRPNAKGKAPIALTAHLDTVLAPQRPEDISMSPDGKLHGPGISDNGCGLTALLSLARALNEVDQLEEIASSVLIVANVGEEGEGNLNGMRFFCRHGGAVEQVKAFVVLDGPSLGHITAEALSSRRFEILFEGPGGHSWNDQGTANPVHALSHTISSFVHTAEFRNEASGARSSYNFGIVEGGASVNSIPAQAMAKLDLRSEEIHVLEELSAMLTGSVERALELENRNAKHSRLTAKIRELGSRPGGQLSSESILLRTIQSVDAHLKIQSRVNCASTDANIPLSLGLPAISIGTGGQGGGAHTTQEWFHPDGRETGLHRTLLLLAALSAQLRDSQEQKTI